MSNVDLVRASRDGDQFHYLWAARKCLLLLSPATDLVAVSIEGPSIDDASGVVANEGEEVIDVGLYFTSEDPSKASRVEYVQLKHSTVRADNEWTGSGLKTAIVGFAKRFSQLRNALGAERVRERLTFQFVTNRPIALSVLETLQDLAADQTRRHTEVATLLEGYSSLKAPELTEFFSLFKAEEGAPDIWNQRNLLSENTAIYLSDPDYDAADQLLAMVTKRALTESKDNPTVRKEDVLRALKVSSTDLFPAPCEIEVPQFDLARKQDAEVLRIILNARAPVIIHAEGGVGKSNVARKIAAAMPAGSHAVLYDCFGNGLYRNSMHLRHRHRDALVQIGNELASRGLCQPLIPSPHSDDKHLVRALHARLSQAAQFIRASVSEASLCIIIDAADNAGMAAQEFSQASFVRDLMTLTLPEGVRLAFTCRSHRQALLHPVASAVRLELQPFSLDESASHLRRYYADATDSQASQFAVLSSHNPRVQTIALSLALPLPEMLARLGPTPTDVDRTIAELLNGAVEKLREESGVESAQVDIICSSLSMLRPLIPIPVLARIAGTSEEAIRSFALDLSRPLLVKGDSLHFLDEPSETWFREKFRPDGPRLQEMLQRLRPLAATSAYAAALLPQFLLDAGHLDELLDLALSDRDLPKNNPIARRDVELQRLTFALKAALAGRRNMAAAKLSLRAAGETAAESRQNELVQENTDLAARLLDVDRIEEVVSRRSFSSTWMGSANIYYAGLLAGKQELHPLAAGRLRNAKDWLYAWGREARQAHADGTRIDEDVSDKDRAEFTLAELRLNGAAAAAQHLRRWSPKRLSYAAGRIVVARLFDHGDTASVDALFDAAGNNVWLLLAISYESEKAHHRLPELQLGRLLKLLSSEHVQLEEDESYSGRWSVVAGVVAAVELALATLPREAERWAKLISRYLPASAPYDLAPRHDGVSASLLRAYAVHAELAGKPLTLKSLAHERLQDKIDESGKALGHDSDAESFCRDVGAVLGWFVLAAKWTCGTATSGGTSIGDEELNRLNSAESRRYFENSALSQTVAVKWLSMLVKAKLLLGEDWTRYEAWFETKKGSLWPQTLTEVCRISSRAKELELFALNTATYTFGRIEAMTDEGAESRVSSYTALARSIVSLSPDEAAAYFDRAIVISGRIGTENLSRWNALVHLGKRAGDSMSSRPELTYRFAQAAELTNTYADRGFDWRGTVQAMAGMCGPSLLAIFSRWRDRATVDHKYLAPIVVSALIFLGKLPAKARIALSGLDAEWTRIADLEAAVAESDSKDARLRMVLTGYRYIRMQAQSKAAWGRIKELSKQVGVQLLDAERLERLARAEPNSGPERWAQPYLASIVDGGGALTSWTHALEGIDLSNGPMLKSAWRRIDAMKDGASFAAFVGEVLRRAGPAKLAATISAMVDWGDLELFEVSLLLQALSSSQQKLLSVQVALKAAVLDVCRREPHRITRRGRNAYLPLEELHRSGIVPDQEVVEACLLGYQDLVGGADAEGLFHLLDSLSTVLSADEAASALEYGLDLLQEALVDEKGDGQWKESLRPPTDILNALAGYIWSGLASPTTSQRWEFAHIVRNIAELKWDDLLDELCKHWARGTAGAFGDQRLEFYALHARQWLILGLERGTRERGALPPACLSMLRGELESAHVLIRSFAAEALLAAGAVLDAEDEKRLRSINVSIFPEEVVHSRRAELGQDQPFDDVPDAKEFHFGIDIGPYWFAPLGDAFNLSQSAVEKRVRRTIVDRLGLETLTHPKDARYSLGVFPGGGWDTYHKHNDKPKIDDLQGYASYHAMMFVAAELLDERATLRMEDEDENRFPRWLLEHGLTRADGKWLSDLRDPQMTHVPALAEGTAGADWCWSVTRDYLDAQLRSDEGSFVLWGEWGFGSDGDGETISISSAITNKTVGPALLTALQTAGFERYFLLAANDRDDEANPSLPLFGWVNRGEGWHLLDEQDPWAAGLRYPDMIPSDEVAKRMSLTVSDDGRSWIAADGGTLRSESWSRTVGHGRQAADLPGGRLVADSTFLNSLLSEDDACLIVEVCIRVRVEHRSSEIDDSMKYPWPYSRYYLIDRDGKTQAL